MYEIKETLQFSRWFRNLTDLRAKAKILIRLERARAGNLGDVAAVGNGISEMRIFVGKGYRVYFTQKNRTIIFLLCGGNKSTQGHDIAMAKQILNDLEKANENPNPNF